MALDGLDEADVALADEVEDGQAEILVVMDGAGGSFFSRNDGGASGGLAGRNPGPAPPSVLVRRRSALFFGAMGVLSLNLR